MQPALYLVAAILLGLSKALCLFAGASLGGHNAISIVLANVQGPAAFAVFPIAIATLCALQWVAGKDRDGSGAWRHASFHSGRIDFLQFSCKTPLESANSFICNGR
jgi:type IV secretory pathway VirB2 component (pilin)